MIGLLCRLAFTPFRSAALALGMLLSTAGGCDSAAQAQEAPADTAATMQVEMEPVEVTAAPFEIAGEAASFAVSARTRTEADLNTTPSLSLERITDGVPGLYVGSREHYALGDRLTIRGLGWRAQFGVRGVQVLLDGIPLTVADGQSMIGIVDPSFVRSLEVIRGPASTFWGNASGGVVALSTQPDPEAHVVRAKQTAGSYGLSKTDLQVTPDVGPHRLSVYSSYLAQDGYRAHSDTRLSRTGITSDLRLGEGRGLRTIAALQYMPEAQNPSTLNAEAVAEDPTQVREATQTFDTGKKATQGQLGTTYYDDLGPGELRTTAYGIFREVENPIPFGYIDLSRRVAGARVTLQSAPVARSLSWGVGLEGKLQRDDRREFGNDGGEPDGLQIDQLETVDNVGVFGRAALLLGRLRLSAGLRYDRMHFEADDQLGSNDGSRTFDTFSPSVGLSANVGTARLFANLASGLEAPTANELSNRPDGQTGFNPNLAPEDVWGVEAGVQGALPAQRLAYDVAVFGTQVNDLLVPQQGANEQTFFRNAGETRHAGVEAALRWAATDALSLNGSYTFVHAEFMEAQTDDGTALDGNRIPGVPPHVYSASARWRSNWLQAAVRANGLGTYEVNSTNTADNDGYVRFDVELGHPGLSLTPSTSLAPFVAVNNVFDTQYNDVVVNAFGGRYYEPAAERHYRFGVTLQVE
jgi:iron complex outermembrane receptor protein